MPRTVTVSFDDGSQHVYQNVPDDVTPDQMTKRVARDFSDKTPTNIDGGSKTVKQPVEDPGPTHAEDGGKLTPEAQRMEKLLRKADASGGGDFAKGVAESALTAGSKMLGAAVGGIAGLGKGIASMASGDSFDTAADKANKAVENVSNAMTYEPSSATGKVLNAATTPLMEAPGAVLEPVGGAIGEAVGGVKGRAAGEALFKAAPALIPAAMGLKGALAERPSAPISSRGAKKLQAAMEDMTPEDLAQAKELLQKSYDEGVPLTGPEAFKIAPKLHELITDVDKSNNVVARFVKDRPDQARAAIQEKLDSVGEDVGLNEAANGAQEAADTAITNAQKFRTEAASPDYKAQRTSDAEAVRLMDDITSQQKDIQNGTAWKNDAVQQAGKWYQFSHEMGLKANEVAQTVLDWSRGKEKEAPDNITAFEGEGGSLDVNAPKREAVQNYLNRAGEGKAAVNDAVNIARDRQNYIDQWQKELNAKADQLAQKNLPFIQEKLQSFMSDLDQKIRLAHPETIEGKILTDFKNDLAPGGTPLTLPSQLESVYKANRDKLQMNLNPTPLERTTSGVLKGNVSSLDNLIQEVSPAIKQGRTIYAQLSKEFVDPLIKSPVGRLAGKGADAQKEAVVSRMTSELQSDAATPDRIRMLADHLNDVDPEAFPNMVRSHLENKFDKAATEKIGGTDRLTGAKFAEIISASPKARANLSAMIEKSAEAQGKSTGEARAAARGVSNLMEVLQATGRIAKLGVQGIEETTLMDKAPALAHVKAYGASKALIQSIKDVINKKAYKNLADIFTSPDAIDKMIELASIKAVRKEQRQQLVADLMKKAVAPAAVGAALAPDEAK